MTRKKRRSSEGSRPSRASGDEIAPTLVYGIHAIQEILQQEPKSLEEVLLVEGARGRLKQLAQLSRESGVMVRYRPRSYFQNQFAGKPHQCAAARLHSFEYCEPEALVEKIDEGPLLFLVGVQDPGNVGALLRSARAFGAGGVLLSQRDSCGVTPAVIKASAGATAQLPIAQVHQVQQTMEALRDAGWWLLGLAPGGELLGSFDLVRPTVFLLGAEGKGLKPSVQKHCDALLGIEMVEGWDSLNVSVCGGIALYEYRRQNSS